MTSRDLCRRSSAQAPCSLPLDSPGSAVLRSGRRGLAPRRAFGVRSAAAIAPPKSARAIALTTTHQRPRLVVFRRAPVLHTHHHQQQNMAPPGLLSRHSTSASSKAHCLAAPRTPSASSLRAAARPLRAPRAAASEVRHILAAPMSADRRRIAIGAKTSGRVGETVERFWESKRALLSLPLARLIASLSPLFSALSAAQLGVLRPHPAPADHLSGQDCQGGVGEGRRKRGLG